MKQKVEVQVVTYIKQYTRDGGETERIFSKIATGEKLVEYRYHSPSGANC
jgi:hypothetical protein